ncbi:MAG TPA: hypothetical protein ENJ00_05405 [Phycisphaerales bacterium]|nr:hypothetical protein [Phycisphaerales bacterium]
MSGRVAAILVAILAVLMGITAMVGQRSPDVSRTQLGRLVTLPPSRIGAIEVRTDEGCSVRVAEKPGWSGRLVSWGGGDRPAGSWPVLESTWLAGARLLSSANVQAGPESQLDGGSHVTVLDDAGKVVSDFDLGRRPLGGRVPVRLNPSQTWGTVGKEIADVLKPEALLAWRDLHVLPGMDATVRRIVLTRDGSTLELRRVGRSWSVISPVTETADPEAVQRLIDALVAWQGTQHNDTAPNETCLTLRIELGSDQHNGRTVYTVQTNDNARCRVEITSERQDESDHIASTNLDVDSVPFPDFDTTAFLLRTVLRLPASEISGVMVRVPTNGLDITAHRTPEGWSDGSRDLVEQWLTLLLKTQASDIFIGNPPAEEAGELMLLGFGGLDIGTYMILLDDDRLWIGRGKVWRAYDMTDEQSASLGL